MLLELLVVLVLALLVALTVSALVGRPGPWGRFWALWLVLFLGAWALGVWIEPFGPALWGVTWLPFFLVLVVLALLLAAVPVGVGRSAQQPDEPKREAAVETLALGFVFWLLLAVFLLMIFLARWW